ncbi:MAG TPA: pseudouridine synthase [Bacillota bacterium]|nr:pseudouridine synthase [Bacillota bacterium]
MTTERIAKFLARSGVASRRACEQLVASGRVTLNGVLVTTPATFIDPERDVVAVDGQAVHPATDHIYLALNKPRGVVTTARDTHHRPTVLDLIPDMGRRIYPVGRLDMDSDGLLILTDDGELAFGLTHPSRHAPKTYLVRLQRRVTSDDLARLAHGIRLDDGPTLPAKARLADGTGKLIEIEMHEGRKRQIRRMFASLGNRVFRLTRTRFGCVELGRLLEGSYRELTREEVDGLKRLLQQSAAEGR